VLLALVVVYVLLAMVVGTAVLPNAGPVAQFVYYFVAGLAWVPLAGLVIKWMYAR
jgi:hypothetical protein